MRLLWRFRIWLVTLTNIFFLVVIRIGVSETIISMDGTPAECNLHIVFLLDFVPYRATLFACTYPLDLFGFVVFHHEIH